MKDSQKFGRVISLEEYLSGGIGAFIDELFAGLCTLSPEAQEYNDGLYETIKAELTDDEPIREYWRENYRGIGGYCLRCENSGMVKRGVNSQHCFCPTGRSRRVREEYERRAKIR